MFDVVKTKKEKPMLIKLGKKYKTLGQGIPVEIYSIDNGGSHPVHARMKQSEEDGGGWTAETFTAGGEYHYGVGYGSSLDLVEDD